MFSKVGAQFTRIEGTTAYDQTIVLSCCDLQISTRHLDRLYNAVSKHHCNNRGLVQFNEIQNDKDDDDDDDDEDDDDDDDNDDDNDDDDDDDSNEVKDVEIEVDGNYRDEDDEDDDDGNY